MEKINKIFSELYKDKKQIIAMVCLAGISIFVEYLSSEKGLTGVITASWGAVIMGAIAIGGMIITHQQNKKLRDDMSDAANDALKEEKAKKAALEIEKKKYKEMKISNPFEAMENPYEDLQVDLSGAKLQTKASAQRRADTLYRLRTAAGASGIASLAQALANQGALTSQKIATGIERQVAQNQLMRAKGAMAVDVKERTGAAAADEARRDRQATLLGISYGEMGASSEAFQQAKTNEMTANIAANEAMTESIGLVGSSFSTLGRAPDPNSSEEVPPGLEGLDTELSGGQGGIFPSNPDFDQWHMDDYSQKWQFDGNSWYKQD